MPVSSLLMGALSPCTLSCLASHAAYQILKAQAKTYRAHAQPLLIDIPVLESHPFAVKRSAVLSAYSMPGRSHLTLVSVGSE